jgi:hypothetical protein
MDQILPIGIPSRDGWIGSLYSAIRAERAKRVEQSALRIAPRRAADRCSVSTAAGMSIDVNTAMVDYTLRTVGRILFGADVNDAVPVIRATFPVLNEHIRRRGVSPMRLPQRWPSGPSPSALIPDASKPTPSRLTPDMPTSRSQVAFAAALVATSP